MYEELVSLFPEQSEAPLSGTSRVLQTAGYPGAGNETEISGRIISVIIFTLNLYYFSLVY